MSDPFNCPKCGAHDYGLFAASLVGCPHCNKTELTALRARLADIESQAGDATEYGLAQINLELRGMVVDARAKLAAAERDAARYRHLRSLKGLTVIFRDHVRFKTSSGNKLIEVRTIGEYDLDAALDAMQPRSCGEGEQL